MAPSCSVYYNLVLLYRCDSRSVKQTLRISASCIFDATFIVGHQRAQVGTQDNIRWSERLVGVEVACIPGCLFVSGQSVYQADSLGLRRVHLYQSNLLISAKTAEKKLYPRGHNLTAEIARVAESAQTEKPDISTWQCGTTCR